jgi:dUTP pyrophosphatase
MKLPISRLDRELPLPSYAHPGDAGLDLYSTENVTLGPGDRAAVSTGIAVAIPTGYAGFVHARSGRALKQGLAVVNAPGLIDSGYRGEIKVIVINLARSHDIRIERGEKIAQLVVQAVASVELEEVEELSVSERGEGGFGSTGH